MGCNLAEMIPAHPATLCQLLITWISEGLWAAQCIQLKTWEVLLVPLQMRCMLKEQTWRPQICNFNKI